jgi:RHS repeat-associated protein
MRAENPDVTRDYQYDARGNVNRILENGLTKNTFQYGALNRLSKATNAVGQVAHYEYNGLGFRAGERISDAGLNPLKQVDYVLDLTKQYHNVLQRTQDDQTKSYLWDYNVVADISNESGQFYLLDELGSPLRFIRAGSGIVDSYSYDEFGNDLTGNQGIVQPFGYTGYRYDNVTGMHFAQAREYDSLIGRFSGVDIIKGNAFNPFTLNEYIYCLNNPGTYIDLDGKGAVNANWPGPFDFSYYWIAIEKGNDAHRTLRESPFVAQAPGLKAEFSILSRLLPSFGLSYITKTGKGKADYVYIHDGIGEIYELKANTIYGNTVGPQQVQSYVIALNMNRKSDSERFKAGTTWQSAFNVTLDSVTVQGRKIIYWQDPLLVGDGMIYYKIIDPPRSKKVLDTASASVPEKSTGRDQNKETSREPVPASASTFIPTPCPTPTPPPGFETSDTTGETIGKVIRIIGGLGLMGYGTYKFFVYGDPSGFEEGLERCFG